MPESDSPRSANMRLHLRVLALFLIAALFSTFAPSARAQIGGPNGVKKAPEAAKPAPPSSVTRKYEKDGVAVEFTLTTPPGAKGGLTAGADALASFRVTDTRTGQPLTGLHPNAWVSAVKADRPSLNEAECKDRIRAFMGGLLSVRADIDLNGFLAVTLNHDKTVSFINPQVSFKITKL